MDVSEKSRVDGLACHDAARGSVCSMSQANDNASKRFHPLGVSRLEG